jgi:hypothetical protein
MITSKQEAFALFESKRKEWLQDARRTAVTLARKNNGLVTSDMVHEYLEAPPDTSPSIFGAIFKTDYFEQSGFTITQREKAHARPIRLWRVVESKLPMEWRRRISETGNLFLFE